MRHLYNSRAQVQRLQGTLVHGTPVLAWSTIEAIVDPLLGEPGQLKCRLDLTFVRPGKDQPMPVTAGRAPDRVGVLFCDPTSALLAGDRVCMVEGPVTGIFELRVVPDPAVAMVSVHHLEVQVIEVSQALVGIFPGATVQDVAP
jgi:hypothetical protein